MTERGTGPYIALVIGVLAVSSGALFARTADAPPLVIAAYRVGIAAMVLIPVALGTSLQGLKSISLREWGWGALAGFFLAAHFASWITSLFYTSVANSVVLVNTNPLWVGLFSMIFTRTRPGTKTRLAIGCSVCGAAIIGAGDYAVDGRALWGDFLALVGSWCAAGYLLIGRKLRTGIDLIPYIAVCYGSAGIVLWATVLVLGLPVSGFSAGTWQAFLGLAVVSQLVGHTSYNWALKWFSAELIAISLLGEPVLAALGAFLWFDEPIEWFKIAGGGMILFSIYLASQGESNHN